MLPKNWKKLFDSGVMIPAKMRFCIDCTDNENWHRCNRLVNENKDIEANLNELKRQVLNEFCHMLPYFKE